MQLRGCAADELHSFCGVKQLLRRKQEAQSPRHNGIQTPRRSHQHRTIGGRVPQAVPRIPQCIHPLDLSSQADLHRQKFSLHAVAGRGTKHHGEHQIGGGGGNQQHSGGHIRIKDASRHGDASRHHAQHQHRPGKAAGNP